MHVKCLTQLTFWICVGLLASERSGLAKTFTTLYTFNQAGQADGSGPSGALAIDVNGIIYGTTEFGGSYTGCPGGSSTGCGTVYSLAPPASPDGPWTETILWSFGGTSQDAYYPSGVIMGKGGVLYGVAGGGAGTVFSLAPPTTPGGPWIESVIYQFLGVPDVEFPVAPLTISGNGTLYGSSTKGGTSLLCASGCGTVFSLAPPTAVGGAWTESILWSFDVNSLAGVPEAGVVIGDGVLYGTAELNFNRGFVFSLTPHPNSTGAWALSVLYNFPDSGSQYPVAVTVGPDGNLYGTTALVEKDKQGGTAFLLMPTAGGGSWTKTTLWTFPTGNLNSVSEQPSGSISFARSGGSIFGVTSNKDDALGTVFQLVPPASGSGEWTEDVLDDRHTLTPSLGIVSGGLFYGTDFAGNTVWSVGP